jgi:hypothetical protein
LLLVLLFHSRRSVRRPLVIGILHLLQLLPLLGLLCDQFALLLFVLLISLRTSCASVKTSTQASPALC